MKKTVSIGNQDFGSIRERNCFYIDKTYFIKEWWENQDTVTLIARPRRFGKTLNMSMTEHFFSNRYAGRSDLFEGLSIWEDETYRDLQGTYPVISLSFANIKYTTYAAARAGICQIIADLYSDYAYLRDGDAMERNELEYFERVSAGMDDTVAAQALHNLARYLSRYYGKKVIILLDEYDTPLVEAYINGYWRELVQLIRVLFHSTFKTNPYLERALLTGITRVSRESVFSDLNNLEVVTTTSQKYETSYGFTEQEVAQTLSEFGLFDQMAEVKKWYDGFVFGTQREIYNPWSITKYLDSGKIGMYWTNTSSNGLISRLIREGDSGIKIAIEDLLAGKSLTTELDEQVVFDQLGRKRNAIWSLLLASGYLKADSCVWKPEQEAEWYELSLTNLEVRVMFRGMVQDWFAQTESAYNDFIRALLADDVKAMNRYMNRVAQEIFSYFDTGKHPSAESEPERFYHGFVLGLMVDLRDQYLVTSNRESGFGRYDVVLEPRTISENAYVLEFKVLDPEDEKELTDTVRAALAQIEEKNYDAALLARGIRQEQIRHYGFAFEGKKVLIGS